MHSVTSVDTSAGGRALGVAGARGQLDNPRVVDAAASKLRIDPQALARAIENAHASGLRGARFRDAVAEGTGVAAGELRDAVRDAVRTTREPGAPQGPKRDIDRAGEQRAGTYSPKTLNARSLATGRSERDGAAGSGAMPGQPPADIGQSGTVADSGTNAGPNVPPPSNAGTDRGPNVPPANLSTPAPLPADPAGAPADDVKYVQGNVGLGRGDATPVPADVTPEPALAVLPAPMPAPSPDIEQDSDAPLGLEGDPSKANQGAAAATASDSTQTVSYQPMVPEEQPMTVVDDVLAPVLPDVGRLPEEQPMGSPDELMGPPARDVGRLPEEQPMGSIDDTSGPPAQDLARVGDVPTEPGVPSIPREPGVPASGGVIGDVPMDVVAPPSAREPGAPTGGEAPREPGAPTAPREPGRAADSQAVWRRLPGFHGNGPRWVGAEPAQAADVRFKGIDISA